MSKTLDGKYRTTIVPEFFIQFIESGFPGLKPITYSLAEQRKRAFLEKDLTAQLQIYVTLSGKCYLFLGNEIYKG